MAWQQKARYFGEECYPLAALSIAGHPVVQVLQQDTALRAEKAQTEDCI